MENVTLKEIFITSAGFALIIFSLIDVFDFIELFSFAIGLSLILFSLRKRVVG